MVEGDLHFYFSMLDLQFLERDREAVMTALLQRLRDATFYKVANGTRKDKHGNSVQKFTNRQIDLSQEIVAEAIHLKGPEGEDTMPHIHFILKKNARLGRNYSLLKKHIIAITSEFKLSPHFDEMVEHDGGQVKNLANAVKSISWSWKKMDNATFKRTVIDETYINKTIKLLQSYTLKTNNLTYYIKTMDGLKKRLNRLKTDLYHDNHNLRHTYPIPLTIKDLEVIQFINNKEFSEQTMQPYINTPLLRDFIRYSAGTTTSYIINALKAQTTLLNGIYKNKTAVNNYIVLTHKNPTLKKSQQAPKEKKHVKKERDDRKNFLEVVKSSYNEKSLKAGMILKGYETFSFKKRNGRIIGFSFQENSKTQIKKFTDLGINWPNIKHQLMKNMENQSQKKPLTLDESTDKRQKPPLSPYDDTDIPNTISITYKSDAIKKRKEKESLRAKIKRIENERKRELNAAVERAAIFAKGRIQQFGREIEQLEWYIEKTKFQIHELIGKSDRIRSEYPEHLERRGDAQEQKHTIAESVREVKNGIAREDNLHTSIRERFARQIEPIKQKIREIEDGIATVKRKIRNKLNNSFRTRI